MSSEPSSDSGAASSQSAGVPAWRRNPLVRALFWAGGLLLAGTVSVLIVACVALAVAYPNLPDVSDLNDYRPKLPLRVFSA